MAVAVGEADLVDRARLMRELVVILVVCLDQRLRMGPQQSLCLMDRVVGAGITQALLVERAGEL
jgi:hypothetical protein